MLENALTTSKRLKDHDFFLNVSSFLSQTKPQPAQSYEKAAHSPIPPSHTQTHKLYQPTVTIPMILVDSPSSPPHQLFFHSLKELVLATKDVYPDQAILKRQQFHTFPDHSFVLHDLCSPFLNIYTVHQYSLGNRASTFHSTPAVLNWMLQLNCCNL